MSKQLAIFYLFVIQVIYLVGAVLIALMDNDATQYATIAMQMSESGSYLEVIYRDINYLDKPPLLFWLSSLSFSLFGVSHFAYRLPSIIVNLLGIYATYKLAESFYGKPAGLVSALIYASAIGIVLYNHDVRTDTMLTAFVVFSIWQLMDYIRQGKIINFMLGFIGIGLAMLAKGPIGLMVPMLAIGSQLLYKKQWRYIFHWPWLLGLVIILVILSPMMIGLYNQHGSMGLRFYFWTQSFGRLTGENVWVDTTGPMFFIHSFLWSFLPWSLLAVVAYFQKWILFFEDYKATRKEEVLTLGGITLVFIAMSLSQYKLPHYVFIVYPLIAIMTASYLIQTFQAIHEIKFVKTLIAIQITMNVIIWVFIMFLLVYVFPLKSILIWLGILVVFSSFIYTVIKKPSKYSQLFASTLLTSVGMALVLNMHFYPKLSEYQAGVTGGEYIKEHIPVDQDLVVYRNSRPSLDFYSRRILLGIEDADELVDYLKNKDSIYIFTNDNGIQDINNQGIDFTEVKQFKDFHITTLTLPFLNPATREDATDAAYLLLITNNSAEH